MIESRVYVDRMRGVGGHRYLYFVDRDGGNRRLDTWTGVVARLPVGTFDESLGYRRIA